MANSAHAAQHMDEIYRYQRYIYDLTRKFYLLGRDRVIDELAPPRGGKVLEVACGTVVLAAGGRCFREARERGELSTNHSGATGETTTFALELGAEARDLDALQYHPNGGAWPETMQGYSIPETTRAYGALLLNAADEQFVDELAPRDVVSDAIFREVEEGRGVESPDGRPAVWLDTTR